MDSNKLDLIKRLREVTGISIDKCRRALEAVGYAFDSALEAITAQVSVGGDAKAHRPTKAGLMVVRSTGRNVSLVGAKAETDFASRQERFSSFVELAAQVASREGITKLEELAVYPEVAEARAKLVAQLGENVELVSLLTKSADIFGSYVHAGKVGAIVILRSGSPEVANELAVQVVGYNPLVVSANDLPKELLEREEEAVRQQNLGKPDAIIQKIIEGKIAKIASQQALLCQPFFRDDSVKVGEYLKLQQAEVAEFVRMEI